MGTTMETADHGTRWRSSLLALLVIAMLGRHATTARGQDSAQAPAAEPRRGVFETTFTKRSPLSSVAELTKRLGAKQPVADYDLATQPFLLCVPDDYDPATPYGLVVLMNYKESVEPPYKWLPVMAKAKLIYVMTRHSNQPNPTRVGLALDAAHNVGKQYAIDPKRAYLFSIADAGQLAALNYPDVFHGGVHLQHYHFFRPWKDKLGVWPPEVPPPYAATLTLAKTRRYAFGADASGGELYPLVPKSYTREGFRDVLELKITSDDVHYAHVTVGWFEQAMAFLEAPRPEPRTVATPAPTTAPAAGTPAAASGSTGATSEADRLLGLARSYIAAKSYGPARQRLQAIVDKHPDTPAAREAKRLLGEIAGK